MGKKDKYAEEFEKLQREIVRDRVQAVFDRQPAQFRQGLEEDLQKFAEIVEEFHAETTIDGYDALLALRNLFGPESDKGKIIDFLASELSSRDHEHLTFQSNEDPETHHPRK